MSPNNKHIPFLNHAPRHNNRVFKTVLPLT